MPLSTSAHGNVSGLRHGSQAKGLIERRSSGEGAEFLALMPGAWRACRVCRACRAGCRIFGFGEGGSPPSQSGPLLERHGVCFVSFFGVPGFFLRGLNGKATGQREISVLGVSLFEVLGLHVRAAC